MISAREITLNGYILLAAGLLLFCYGASLITTPYQRFYGVGFLLTGFATSILGVTNGFTDMSPLGRWLAKIAVIAYIGGIPILCFYAYSIF